MYARIAGIKLPLRSTKDRPLMIRTIAYFKDGIHPDPGNVQKGVCDALFYDDQKVLGKKTRKGDDKYTGGSFPPPRYDKENPRVVVIIEDYVPKRRKKDGEEQEEKEKEKGRREERARGTAKKKRAQAPRKAKRRTEKS